MDERNSEGLNVTVTKMITANTLIII